jgi:hypothetical protein
MGQSNNAVAWILRFLGQLRWNETERHPFIHDCKLEALRRSLKEQCFSGC